MYYQIIISFFQKIQKITCISTHYIIFALESEKQDKAEKRKPCRRAVPFLYNGSKRILNSGLCQLILHLFQEPYTSRCTVVQRLFCFSRYRVYHQ